MVTENTVRTELMHKGYDCDITDVTKNGVKFRALTIRNNASRVNPIIYINRILEDANTASEAADNIINLYESHKAFDLGIDPDKLTDSEYIKNHVYIGLQKSSEEDILRRNSMYDGIEEFLYIRAEKPKSTADRWSCKLKPAMLEDLDEAELWKTAEKRTYKDFKIANIGDILSEIGNLNAESLMPTVPLYVITNKDQFRGAALACDLKHIKKWAKDNGYHKAVILPSSIHEMLLVPLENEEYDLDMFSSMVADVNATQVDPTEQLTNRAYIINL